VDDFAVPEIKPAISERWRDFLEKGEQIGVLQLLNPDGTPREVEYTVKGSVLPVRHLLVLRDKTKPAESTIPAWVQDYALFLLDPDGQVAAWYSGAERIYGYTSKEVMLQHVSKLYPQEEGLRTRLDEKLKRAAAEGHTGAEGWHVRKDGSRFCANVITMALKDANGDVQGFARVVRDFSDRHERDEKLRRTRARLRPLPAESTIAGIVSGEFDRIPEANDAFLELSDIRERICWPDGWCGPI
jgi:formate hydrogenlyase transcriptional activator